MSDSCLFCKIAKKEVTAKVIFENDLVLAFHDIHPLAPIHILIIPKKHIESMNDVSEKNKNILGEMLFVASKLAKELGISENGYKLLIRTGRHGGQEVPHIHLHLIGGSRLSEGIHPIH
jgi:histidine triad (HIT) family protein